MAHVVAGSDCLVFTDGVSEFDVQATTVGGLIAELERRYPGIGEHLSQRTAFAIDGEIHQDALFSPIGPSSEVYLIPKIGGG